jgi:hypothetical protein
MLIKGTTKKGNAIPLGPREALKHAVGRLCKVVNTLENVYWVDHRTIKETAFQSLVDKDGIWEAWAEGTAAIGRTCTKTNNFHVPIPHTFKVHYKLSKDEWGIPDIAVVGIPELTAIERDPSKLAGPMPDHSIVPAPVEQEAPKSSKSKKQLEEKS